MAAPRARWVAFGNVATGFIAFGNVVTGFIAIGNVARGFIAIGNVAIGVIAIGNVGLGIVCGFGATVSLGLFAASGVVALPALDGIAGVVNLAQAAPILPVVAWLLASVIYPGRRTPPSGAALTPLSRLRSGDASEGWIRARADRSPDGALRLAADGAVLEVPASPEVLGALDDLARAAGPRPHVIALLRAEEVLREQDVGYREAGQRERVLACAALDPAPPATPPWLSADDVQWWLARAWRAGAVVAVALAAALAAGRAAGWR
jgi:hypothetical protein